MRKVESSIQFFLDKFSKILARGKPKDIGSDVRNDDGDSSMNLAADKYRTPPYSVAKFNFDARRSGNQ